MASLLEMWNSYSFSPKQEQPAIYCESGCPHFAYLIGKGYSDGIHTYTFQCADGHKRVITWDPTTQPIKTVPDPENKIRAARKKRKEEAA